MELFYKEKAREHTFSFFGVCRVFGDKEVWYYKDIETGKRYHLNNGEEYSALGLGLQILGVEYKRMLQAPKMYIEQLKAKNVTLIIFKVKPKNLLETITNEPNEIAISFDYKLASDEMIIVKVEF